METGIFAKTFKRSSIAEVFEAVRMHGFSATQFNLSCAGLPTLPDHIPAEVLRDIRKNLDDNNLDMAALSGTYNMIHPDITVRENNMQRLQLLIRNCRAMGTNVVSICTGTRDIGDMWTGHPDNNTPEAWRDLCLSLEKILTAAEEAKVLIAFEPEFSNVVYSAAKGKQLIEEMKSDNLKVIFDPANLFEKGSRQEIERIIAEGLSLLGEHIIIAHAKDRMADGSVAVAGKGILPYPFFIRELKKTGFDGELIAHGLDETQAHECNRFLNQLIS